MKKWDLAFTSGNIGCDYKDFVDNMKNLSGDEFYYIMLMVDQAHIDFTKEKKRRENEITQPVVNKDAVQAEGSFPRPDLLDDESIRKFKVEQWNLDSVCPVVGR